MSVDVTLKNKIAVITGWGTGLAVLFLIGDGNIKLSRLALNVLDSALAVSVAIFFMLIVSVAAVVFHTTKDELTKKYFMNLLQAFQLLLLAIFFILTGSWLLFYFAPDSYGAMRTATTLGVLMLGVVVIVVNIVVIRFFKWRKM